MFAQIDYPDKLLPEELDKYLADGWFRMRQAIFTTNFLHFNQQFYSAIWLRVALAASIADRKFHALNKINKGFRVEIKKTSESITLQQESLYQIYRQSIAFEISSSLQELLFGNQTNNRFNTHEVNIFDGNTMIAAGFFDLGKTSAAGITSIYHPAYKKYSPGKYLVYLKMDFCRRRQMEYFYPGYLVPGYASFDYKLDIAKASLQYLQLSTHQWIPYLPAMRILNPLQEMLEKLGVLKNLLLDNNISNTISYYKFFEANLDPYYRNNELFDFPVFLYCFPCKPGSFFTVATYDVRDAKYHLFQCSSIINLGFQQNSQEIFDTDLLNFERSLFTTASPEEMTTHFLRLF